MKRSSITLIVSIIISLILVQGVSAKEFDRSVLEYPGKYLHWLIDLYTIEMNADLSSKDTGDTIHRMGEVDHKVKSIKVSERVDSESRQLEIINHEIGHIVDRYYFRSTEDMEFIKIFEEESKRLSMYSNEYFIQEKVKEFFAESYMFYMLYPSKLFDIAPKVFGYINKELNYYTVNIEDKSLSKNKDDLLKEKIIYTHVKDGKIIDNKGRTYESTFLLLSEDRGLICWGEENEIKQKFSDVKKELLKEGKFNSPDALYILDLDTRFNLTAEQKSSLINFYMNGGYIEMPFNLLNQKEDYVREKLDNLKELGF